MRMEDAFKMAVGAVLGIAVAGLMVCGVIAFGALVVILSAKNVFLGAFAAVAFVIGAVLGAIFIPRTL